MTYKPHGEIWEQTGYDVFRFAYNEHEKDATGLVNYGARFYDPELQHFITADSLIPDITSTQSFNPYMYVKGNPIGFRDMDGHVDTDTYCDDTVEEVNGDKCTKDDPAPETKKDPPKQDPPPAQNPSQDTPPAQEPPPSQDPYKDAGHGSEGTVGNGKEGFYQMPFASPQTQNSPGMNTGPLHDALTAGGFGPGVGALCDLANSAIYAAEGNWGDAKFAAFAAIPIVGDIAAGGKIGKTVIGHAPEYVTTADKLGARKFSIPDKIWDKMSLSEKWAANKKFLDRTISRDGEFILATPIERVRPGSYYEKEILYLIDKGYDFSSDYTRMRKY